MLDRWEATHVGPNLSQDGLGQAPFNSRNGLQWLEQAGTRPHAPTVLTMYRYE